MTSTDRNSLNLILSNLEWRWSLFQLILGVPAAIASFALPAWAISATSAFDGYSPSSWVIAGFAGIFVASISYYVGTAAFARRIRTRYDARMLAIGGAIDPLEKTFERKRIYLNEFCLPSHPLIEDKTFIDCEMIGPANMLFVSGNNITQGKFPIVDAVYLEKGAMPNNVYLFKDCIFRGCNFTRITYFVAFEETNMFKDYPLVRWVTPSPYGQIPLPLPTPSTPDSSADIGTLESDPSGVAD